MFTMVQDTLSLSRGGSPRLEGAVGWSRMKSDLRLIKYRPCSMGFQLRSKCTGGLANCLVRKQWNVLHGPACSEESLKSKPLSLVDVSMVICSRTHLPIGSQHHEFLASQQNWIRLASEASSPGQICWHSKVTTNSKCLIPPYLGLRSISKKV